jgi:RNA polymerase sigma factor (TIGR02999 family)
MDRLFNLVYEPLKVIARRKLWGTGRTPTLGATALVHEAYFRLVDQTQVEWQDRGHFFAVCARIMRRILVDAARAQATAKRGGHVEQVAHATAIDFDEFPAPHTDRPAEVCALDDALTSLARLDPRRARVIEMRFFGGLSVEQTAEALAVSPQTVMRDWRLARAWLTRELRR